MVQNPRQGGNVAEGMTRSTAEQVRHTADTMAVTGEQAARAGAETLRHNSETVQDAWQSGTKVAQQIAERSFEWTSQAFGLSGNGTQDAMAQSSRNLNVILETSTALAEGIQSISREWALFARRRTEKNLNKFDEVVRCKTVHELMAVNTELMKDNLEDLLHNSQRISEMATKMAQDATRKISEAPLSPR